MRIEGAASSVSASDASQINDILNQNFPGTTVKVTAGTVVDSETLGACETACTIAETAAVQACNGISNPIARELCKAAARAAGDACRRAC